MKSFLAVVVGLVAVASADVSWGQWGPVPPAGHKFPGYQRAQTRRVYQAPVVTQTAPAPVERRTFSAEPAPAPAAAPQATAPSVRTFSAEPSAPVYRSQRRARLNPYAMPNADSRKFSL